MNAYEQSLCELEKQIERKAQLDEQLPALYARQEELTQRVADLKELKELEQSDVARLEKGGLESLFYRLTGKKETMLAKEKREAQQAKEKYEAAMAELETVKADVEACEKAIYELDGCERRYKELYEQKEAQARASDSPVGGKIAALEKDIEELEAWRQELRTASKAGEDVLETAEEIADFITKAVMYSRYDTQSMRFSDKQKYDCIREAKARSGALRVRLKRFQEALNEAKAYALMILPRCDIERMMEDMINDNIYIDWKVYKELLASQQYIINLKLDIRKTLDKVYAQHAAVEGEQNRLREEIRRLITEA